MITFECSHIYAGNIRCDDERLHRRYKDPHRDEQLDPSWDGTCNRTGCKEKAEDRTTYVTIRAQNHYKRFCALHEVEEARDESFFQVGL